MLCGIKDFHDSKVAYSIDTEGAAKENIKHLDDNLGVTALPSVIGKPMRSFFSTISFYVPLQHLSFEGQKSLKRVIDFLTSADAQQKLATEQYLMPAHFAVEKQLQPSGDIHLIALYQQLQQSMPMPPTQTMQKVWVKMREHNGAYLDNRM